MPPKHRGPSPSEKTVRIVAEIREGKTYRTIAKEYGISFQRVGEIAKQHGATKKKNVTREAGYEGGS